jgi:hypothetical protein
LYTKITLCVATLTLGSRPRQGVARLRAKKKTRESHHMLLGVQRMWGNEPLHSQMNSHVGSWSPKWISKSSKCNCRGQNPSVRRDFYIIAKLLKHRCLKWARIAHLDIWNTSYDQKKSRESNWQLNSRPLKIGNRLDFLACRWRATYFWKAFNEGYNFALYLIAIWGLHAKLCAPKSQKSQLGEFRDFHLGVLGQKTIWSGPRGELQSIYYKREGGAFPQLRVVVSLVNPNCPWFVLAPKVLQLCTNHLMLGLCRFVWVVEACQFFLVPSQSFNTPLYPFKVLQAKERAPTLYFSFVFSLWLTFESLKELGACHYVWSPKFIEHHVVRLNIWWHGCC